MLQVLPAVYGVAAVLLAVWPVDVGAASSLRRIALSAGTRCRVTEFAGSLRGWSKCQPSNDRHMSKTYASLTMQRRKRCA